MIVRLTDTSVEHERECLAGLRMTADEFFEATERVPRWTYQLVDGVVVMTPSPVPTHQRVAAEILYQISNHLRSNAVGAVLGEIDIELGIGPNGGGLVYQPDIVFYRRERLSGMNERLVGPPDLVVEVLSPSTRRFDKATKMGDYERLGVREFWVIDPMKETMSFYESQSGRFVEMQAHLDSFTSEAVQGFVLDLKAVRDSWQPW